MPAVKFCAILGLDWKI